MRLVARDYRPVIVIDDTEHFVNAADGRIDRVSVRNLYHHAIRPSPELDQLDIIVAVHPAYEDVDAVIQVLQRFAFRRVEVPALAVDRDEPAIAAILQRRLDRNGLRVKAEPVVDAGGTRAARRRVLPGRA